MKTGDFDFDLPARFIAQRPVAPRDEARLLCVGGGLRDRAVRDLPRLLGKGDLMVFNDTRVIPCRLYGRREGGERDGQRDGQRDEDPKGGPRIQVTLHQRVTETVWRAFARPAKKLSPGDGIRFAAGFSARVTAKGDGGDVTLEFPPLAGGLMAALEQHGTMPLPPYIKRGAGGEKNAADGRDRRDYQTLFADRKGAVAAPTAGLHFTPELMAALDARGVGHAFLTLHVGAGTFLPVRVEDFAEHKMHAEWGEITPEAAAVIQAARDAGGRIVAVGTTVLRLLESAVDGDGRVQPFCGETDIFITPGDEITTADLLMTNFHLPRSTLFMLVAAFAGLATMKAAYHHAKKAGYRFYSYGDACLLERGLLEREEVQG